MADFPDITIRQEGSFEFPDLEDITTPIITNEQDARNNGLLAALAEMGTSPEEFNDEVFAGLAEQKTELMRRGKELDIRMQEDQKARDRFLKSVVNEEERVLASGAGAEKLAKSIRLLEATKRFRQQNINPDSLEERAVESLLSLQATNPDLFLGKLLADEKLGEGSIEQITNIGIKRAKIMSLVNKQDKLLRERPFGIVRDIFDAFAEGTELVTGRFFAEDVDYYSSWYNPAGRYDEQMKSLFDMPIKNFADFDFDKVIRQGTGLFTPNESEYFSMLIDAQGFAREQRPLMNLMAGLDYSALIPSTRIFNSFKGFVTSMGGHDWISDAAIKTLKGDTSNVFAKEVGNPEAAVSAAVGDALPGGVSLDSTGIVSPSLSSTIQAKLAAQDAVVELSKDLMKQQIERLTPEEAEEVASLAADRMTASLKNQQSVVKNYTVDATTSPIDPTKVTMFIGPKDSPFFTNREAARVAKRKLGLEGKAFDLYNPSKGEWYITTTKEVDETGTIVLRELEETQKQGLFKWYLGGGRNVIGDEMYSKGLWTTLQQSGFYENVFKPLEKDLRGITKGRKERLTKVVNSGINQEKYFNADEFYSEYMRLNKKVPIQEDFVAYEALRKVRQIDEFVRNHHLRSELATKGFKEVFVSNAIKKAHKIKFRTPLGKAIVTPQEIGKVPIESQFIHNVSNNTVYKPGELTREQFQKMLKAEDMHLIKLRGDQFNSQAGGPIMYIIGKRGDLGLRELPSNVLGSVDGGWKEYHANYLLKQHREGKYNKTGARYVRRPAVYMGAQSARELQPVADNMNDILAKYKQWDAGELSEEEFEAALQGSYWDNLSSGEFRDKVLKGDINPDSPIEIVGDRELPTATRNIDRSHIKTGLELDDDVASIDYYESQGRMYYSRRGEGLKGPTGHQVELLDPFKVTAKALGQVNKLGATNNYKLSQVKHWVRMARPYLDSSVEALANKSDMELFLNGTLRSVRGTEPDSDKIIALNHLRTKIKEVLGAKSDNQHLYEAKLRRLANTFDEKGWDKLRDWTFNLKDTNPARALKAWNFDTKMGFFSPAQILLQGQTSFAVLALHPVLGSKAIAKSPLMRAALVNGSDNFLDMIAKKYPQLHGTSVEDFKDMVTAFKRSGFYQPGNEMQLFEGFSNSVGDGLVVSGAKKFREAGRFFVLETERWNRINAWSIAWDLAKEAGKDMKAIKTWQEVAMKADDLTFNMTSAGKAWWQTGGLTLPTQFLGYQARFIEAMLPEMLGGSKAFTSAEKLRLAMGQMALYGTAGIPFSDWIFDMWLENTGEEMDLDTYDLVSKGLMDQVLHALSGVNTNFAHRAALGPGISANISKLSDNFSNFNFAEVLLGPSGATISGTWDALTTSLHFLTLGAFNEDIEVTPNIVENVFGQFSGLNDAQKALMIYNLGLITTKTGGVIADVGDNKEQYAFMRALGIRPSAEISYYKIVGENSDDYKDLQEQARHVLSNKIRAGIFGSESAEEVAAHLKVITATTQAITGGDRGKQDILMRTIAKDLGYEQKFSKAIDNMLRIKGPSARTKLMMEELERARGE